MDENVVVQGVAGAGKTNVCIDKLIYSACRNYSGKILYTTYSKGLLNTSRLKVESLKTELREFIGKYRSGQVVFLDANKKKALENKFGIYFFVGDNDDIIGKVERIVEYLDTKVDYFLIDELYKKNIDSEAKFVGENYFINNYLKNINNHQISKELNLYRQNFCGCEFSIKS